MSSGSRRKETTEPAADGLGRVVIEGSADLDRRDATERAPGREGTQVAAPRSTPAGAGRHFGNYEVVQHLATGGMGELLLARQAGIEGFEREVAIKTLLPHMNDDREFVTMFLDEARIAARLSHPNIVQILELGEEGGRYYIAMEYVDGVNLADLLLEADAKGHRGMPLAAAMPVAIDVCSALHYAHERRDRFGEPLNIVHRDVSPHNVLIAYDGTVKLADFGVAAADNKVHRTQTGTVKGKMTFMSPEQAMARPVDRRSDVFALGIVLYLMLTGTHPFEPPEPADERDAGGIQTLLRILNEPPPNPRRLRSDLPKRLAKALLKAMRKDAGQRFATAAEMRSALEAAAAAERIVPSREAVAEYLREIMPERVEDYRSRTEVRGGLEKAGVHEALALAAPETVQTGEVPMAPPGPALGRRPSSRPRAAVVAAAAFLVGFAVVAGAVALWHGRSGPAEVDGSGAGDLGADAGAGRVGARTAEGDGGFEIIAWAEDEDADEGDGSPVATLDFDGGLEDGGADEDDEAGPDGAVMAFDGGAGGTLSIQASPAALVFLGRTRVGWTPLDRAPVPAGSYPIRLRSGRQGLDYTLPDRVVIGVGEQVDLGSVVVPRGAIRLAVYPWARVSVNGRSLGSTPIPPIGLYPGTHRVLLSCGDGRGANTVRSVVRVRPRHTSVVRHRFTSCR